MDELKGALPLVTLTLTTDEIAMTHAGLLLLRKFWASRAIDLTAMGGDAEPAQKTIQHISLFLQRLSESVTEEQGRDLMNTLIRDLRRKPR